jgi:hypothetical protein
LLSIDEEMKHSRFHMALTLLLALLQAGFLAAMPAAELCSAGESTGVCLCGSECCGAERPASLPFKVLRESPCCTLQAAHGEQDPTVPTDRTPLPVPPRIAPELHPAASVLPDLPASGPALVSIARIPCVTTASIPLLNSSLLI